MVALFGGGHIAEIRFAKGDRRRTVNPMRIPHYPTIEPHQYKPAEHDALYGDGPHRWLSSGYMGHLLCFPSFGPPSSDEEIRNGLGNHGEAPIVEWKLRPPVAQDSRAVSVGYGSELTRTQFRVERTVSVSTGEAAVLVNESVENLAPYDRPINWVQHATFGPPFAAPGKMYMDVSATRGEVGGGRATNSLQAQSQVTWPRGTTRDGAPADLRVFQPAPRSGTYYALQMDPSRPHAYFTMYNPDYSVLIGYLFPTADNPWLGDWQENQSNTTRPWDGKAIARGIEFGTTPFAEGLRKSVERGKMFDVPTFRWIGGRQTLKTWWLVFLAEIPSGFQGVADVRADGHSITTERGTGRTITVACTDFRRPVCQSGPLWSVPVGKRLQEFDDRVLLVVR